MAIKRYTADVHFSKAIRMRAEWCCESCGAVGSTPGGEAGCKLDCAHLLGRRNISTRWDALNACSLCVACHFKYGENPADFYRWVDSMWPGRWDILYEKRRHIVNNNPENREDAAKHYLEECKRMERTGNLDLVSWI